MSCEKHISSFVPSAHTMYLGSLPELCLERPHDHSTRMGSVAFSTTLSTGE
jgi:hypothetical protein